MLILTIRTDKPDAELGLYEDDAQLAYTIWPAHRELSVTIQSKVEELLKNHGKDLKAVKGVVAYKGPGSFTGLRIGLTVANALAYGLQAPIVATTGADWISQGRQLLQTGHGEHLVFPEYGAPPHITKPKH